MLSNEKEKWMETIVNMKNCVIGNNKQKATVISNGVIPSLAKGTDENIRQLLDAGSINVLLKGLSNSNLKFVEACLRCLRTLFLSCDPPVDLVYQDATVVPHLINIMSKSVCTQECITTIFANCCKISEHQNILCSNGVVAALAPLLTSTVYKVQMPTLKCFAALTYQNEEVAKSTASATYNGDAIPVLLVKLLTRDKTSEMQMAAARCLTYLCRGGAISPQNPVIMLKTLPTLIRMCKKDRTLEENVEGAETLAYLIEDDAELQKVAAISDHIIRTLAEYLRYTDVQQINTRTMQRKTENLMDHILNGMNSDDTKVKVAAVRCLHSLSRSVQQLRTTFQDHAVWKPLMTMMQQGTEDVLGVTSSTLCNLLLEFSPSKELHAILESGVISILVNLTGRHEAELRLNGIWGLMF
ncbi:hypothetical protein KUTeg_002361 [Tegillarca granosa]|uniref:Armadillo repeat-containing protein 8 n=1 Tax=Tegillarca granosa TaxID=220873 RepID=A0ABQ9FU59_TEGGR|nr:hypothetical protein KUTeg_002361 [Tegillarca granosa]